MNLILSLLNILLIGSTLLFFCFHSHPEDWTWDRWNPIMDLKAIKEYKGTSKTPAIIEIEGTDVTCKNLFFTGNGLDIYNCSDGNHYGGSLARPYLKTNVWDDKKNRLQNSQISVLPPDRE